MAVHLCSATSFSAFDASRDKIYPDINERIAEMSPAARMNLMELATKLNFFDMEKTESSNTMMKIPMGK
jgi:hypothetical protein